MRTIGIWGLREEARKSWDYVISDKIIYLGEPLQRHLEVSHVLAEKYLNGDVWFEIHWTLVKRDQREMHFNCICEVVQVSLPSMKREVEIKRSAGNGNRPMFVHVPEFVELPEGVIPIGATTAVRLKQIEFACHCGWEKAKEFSAPVVVDLEDGELNAPLLCLSEGSDGRKMSQGPSELIERGTQAANKVPNKHGDEFWSNFVLDPHDVDGLLEIVVVGDGMRIRVNPILHDYLKRIEVKLRPAGFHVYIDESRVNGHSANSLAGCGTISA